MEHEYYTSKDKLKTKNISFENMNYNNENTTQTTEYKIKDSSQSKPLKNKNNLGVNI